MNALFYAHVAAVILTTILIIGYRLGASSLRSELQIKARELEALVFPAAVQGRFHRYSAIPLKVLFRPESLSPSLPPAVLRSLLALRRTAVGATVVMLVSFVLLAFLVMSG